MIPSSSHLLIGKYISSDKSVRIEADDQNGMQRLIEYIARCPFSLARMVSLTDNGKILYRASKPGCIPFPKQGEPELDIGIPRNYEIVVTTVYFVRYSGLWPYPDYSFCKVIQ